MLVHYMNHKQFFKKMMPWICLLLLLPLVLNMNVIALETGVRESDVFYLVVKDLNVTFYNGTSRDYLTFYYNESSFVNLTRGDIFKYEVLEIRNFSIILYMTLLENDNSTILLEGNITSILSDLGAPVITTNVTFWEEFINGTEHWTFNYTRNDELVFYYEEDIQDKTFFVYLNYDAITGMMQYEEVQLPLYNDTDLIGELKAVLEQPESSFIIQIGLPFLDLLPLLFVGMATIMLNARRKRKFS